MTTFWIFIVLFILVSLLLIWLPFFRQRQNKHIDTDVRQSANIALYKEKITFLEQELAEQQINAEEFQTLKHELEITLLQDTKQGNEEDSNAQTSHHKSPLWPALMSIVLLSVGGYFYHKLGAYQILNDVPQLAQSHTNMSPEQIMRQQLAMMEQQVKKNPKDSETWFSLGHAYMSLGRYQDAIDSFNNAIKVDGETAELLGPKATAMYYQAGQVMTPQIQTLIDKALELDPSEPSTLLLVGMDAFFQGQYQKAIDAWQRILDSQRSDIDVAAVNNAIAEAKKRLAPPVDSSKLGVTITLTVTPELAKHVSPKDTIYLFARTSGDKIIPIAATKITAEALPIEVKLDQSNVLGTGTDFSQVKTVDVIALLTKSGKLKAEKGDLQGRLSNVKVGSHITLPLNELIK
ncbi:c-type cytochrome biogenesis protein CcmI [Parashewanella tropica]|uniref:c-type cytochrome biogenesis protein CcmI n=1 Tax=Parashewanella tropica TaxID=2547970 RepID=UPI00105A09C7|nr:c-type cytochrome biogenesis protein CcmI [Parashewanella tropica]